MEDKYINTVDVDALKMNIKNISVSINGSELPLKIGDVINIESANQPLRTIMKIQVNEDGNALYCLEWFDGTEFKSEWISLVELWHILKNTDKKNVTGFQIEEE